MRAISFVNTDVEAVNIKKQLEEMKTFRMSMSFKKVPVQTNLIA